MKRKYKDILVIADQTDEVYVRVDHMEIHAFLIAMLEMELQIFDNPLPYIRAVDVIKFHESEDAAGRTNHNGMAIAGALRQFLAKRGSPQPKRPEHITK